jgi:hypothetical protein
VLLPTLLLMTLVGSCAVDQAGPAATSAMPGMLVTTVTDDAATLPADPSPGVVEADVVVAGDGLGGVGAAVQAGRRGHRVTLLSPLGYVGGQATAAGVTSMDEASGRARTLLRRSGLYRELSERVTARSGGRGQALCYFGATDTFCPAPDVMRDVLRAMLREAGVEVVRATPHRLLRAADRVVGVEDTGGGRYYGRVVDATEFGDLLAQTGTDIHIGNFGTGACVQDLTHSVVMAWYPDGPPQERTVPADAIDVVMRAVGPVTVRSWLDEFRSLVSHDGHDRFERWARLAFPLSPELADRYRGMDDGRADVRDAPGAPEVTVSAINLANDVPVPRAAVEGAAARLATFRLATLKSYLYMWYDRWELGRSDWGVASHLGYDEAQRHLWLDEIPDAIERHMPPEYYIREARRLGGPGRLEGHQIRTRGIDRFDDSVMLGGSRSDADHGECRVRDSELNPDHGAYDVPLSVFVPHDVPGLLVGVARNGNVDRAVSASIRMHPPELLGGQAVGMLVSLAIEAGVDSRDVPVEAVRTALAAVGATIDVPERVPTHRSKRPS